MAIDTDELMPRYDDLMKRAKAVLEQGAGEREKLAEEFAAFATEARATGLRLGEFLAVLARQAAQELR